MLSGVGPREHLQELGINTLADLPVGYNLQDHITFSGNAFIVNTTGLCVNDVSNFFNFCLLPESIYKNKVKDPYFKILIIFKYIPYNKVPTKPQANISENILRLSV